MMYSYKLVDDQYDDLLYSLLFDPIFIGDNTYFREEIKKVDETNFLSLFYEFTREKSINNLSIIDLECFFTLRISTYFENGKPINATYATINFKKVIRENIINLLSKKINSKKHLIYKLLEIKEEITKLNIPMLNYIIILLSDYCDLDQSFEESKKIHFLLNIINGLKDYKDDLKKLIDEIDTKINSLSPLKKGNYNINVDDENLLKIYNNLEKNDFIDIYKTSAKNFIDVFKLDFESHNSVVDLNMDYIQFKHFITLFQKHLKLDNLLATIENAGNVTTKGKEIIAYKIRTSYSKNEKGPKRQKELETIFL